MPMRGAVALFIALVAITAALLAGAWAQSALAARDLKRHPAPGRLHQVGAHRLHVRCTGSGDRPIVLESGLSGWSQDWSALQPLLDDREFVCSYDRAGYGWSDEAATPRTGLIAVQDLRAALEAAGVPKPRVLVGHSLGGLLVQLYAQEHPQEVSGLVLVDSLQRDQTARMNPCAHARYTRMMRLITETAAVAAAFGLTRISGQSASIVTQRLPPREQPSAGAFGQRASAFRSLRDEFRDVDAALEELRLGKRVSTPPTRVVGTDVFRDFPPGWKTPYMRGLWVDGQRRLAAEFGVDALILSKTGHYIQLERPTLIVQLIEEVMADAEQRTAPHSAQKRRPRRGSSQVSMPLTFAGGPAPQPSCCAR